MARLARDIRHHIIHLQDREPHHGAAEKADPQRGRSDAESCHARCDVEEGIDGQPGHTNEDQ